MSPMLTSQGLVLATAMAVSAGTVILFELFRQHPPPQHHLKSCLSSGRKKKKRRVKFADDVKDSKGNGEFYRKEHSRRFNHRNCGDDVAKMPSNRAALYTGILRDRVDRIGYSY